MAIQQNYVLEGKEFNVWTEKQLSGINRDALKKRCLDLRDHVGQERLPPMPRHPEGMVVWMLDVQEMAMNSGQPAQYQSYSDAPPPPAPDLFDRGGPPGGSGYGGYDQERSFRGYDQASPGDAAYGAYDQEPSSRGYDQPPPNRPTYASSDAGSVAASRVGAVSSATFVFEGKEYNVWTEKQLSAMNRDSLKKRCMDFRDNIGKDRLRPMPRHPEGMVEWLVDAQAMVMQGGGNSAASYGNGMGGHARSPPGGMGRGAQPGGMPRGGPADDFPRDYEPSEAGTEAQSNYEANMREAEAIRRKNQGSRGLW